MSGRLLSWPELTVALASLGHSDVELAQFDAEMEEVFDLFGD
jgi:hypothetical protein